MRSRFRFSLACLLLAVSSTVSAIGFGDLHAQPLLGERLNLAVNLLGVVSPPDASCFSIVSPSKEDSLPWLRDAELRVVPGRQSVLEIRSTKVLREPLMKLAIHVACGYEVQREYVLLASPRVDLSSETPADLREEKELASKFSDKKAQKAAISVGVTTKSPVNLSTEHPNFRASSSARSGLDDHLMLLEGQDGAALRLEKFFERQLIAGEPNEKQREFLRQEFRKLIASHEKSADDAQTVEKLSDMQSELHELRQNILGLSDPAAVSSIERGEGLAPLASDQPQFLPPQNKLGADFSKPIEEASVSDFMLYGLLIGLALGIVGWLLWGKYRNRVTPGFAADAPGEQKPVAKQPSADVLADEIVNVAPTNANEALSPVVGEIELAEVVVQDIAPAISVPFQMQSDEVQPSVGGGAPDINSEIKPVMELADVMLSFGRLKGAAQALQEYIDSNPSEALQPWLRLMDVYRMAGMREEFDDLARNLNQQFNVEIQPWEVSKGGFGAGEDSSSDMVSGVTKPCGVEEMPRIMDSIIRMWADEDVIGYMYQLLRDNRGGQRLGFPLPVVEEILFLIELKETANRM